MRERQSIALVTRHGISSPDARTTTPRRSCRDLGRADATAVDLFARLIKVEPPACAGSRALCVGRRLTERRSYGSILVRQCPTRSGAFLNEAIRPAITPVALQSDSSQSRWPFAARSFRPGALALADTITLTSEGVTSREQMRLLRALMGRGYRQFMLHYHSPSLCLGHTPYARDEAGVERLLDRLRQVCRFFSTTSAGYRVTSRFRRRPKTTASRRHPR